MRAEPIVPEEPRTKARKWWGSIYLGAQYIMTEFGV